MPGQYLSLRRAAAHIGVHHTTLSRAVQRGELAPAGTTPGGRPRFSPAAVVRYAESLLGKRPHAAGDGEALRRATLLLASELQPEVVLQRLAGEARRLVGARYAALGVMDSDGRIRRFFTEGLTPAQRRALGPLPKGRGLLGALFHQGTSLRIDNIGADPRSAGFPPHHPPMRSLLGVPILSGGANVGNIYLTDREDGRPFTEADQRLIEALAQYAAVAIQNARLYEQATNQARLWQALTDISRRIAAANDPRAVLRLIVHSARGLIGADASALMLLTPDGTQLKMAASHGMRHGGMRRLRFARDRGIGSRVLDARRPVTVDDYAQRDWAAARPEPQEEGLVSYAAVPVEARGQQLGVLYAASRTRRVFQREEVDLLGQLAAMGALAFDNARLLEQERRSRDRVAQTEQRLQAVLDNEPEALYVVSPQRRVVLANNAAGKLIARRRRRLVGMQEPFGLTYFLPDGRPLPQEDSPVSLCLAGQGPCLGFELLVQHPDGTRQPFLVNAAALTNPKGTVEGVVVTQQNISRLKEVERIKDEFLSMITHDLKSPLTAIKGLASSMVLEARADGTTSAPVEWAEMIERETDRLTDLVNNLLDMSRLQAGALALDYEECYPVELLEECASRCRAGGLVPGRLVHVDAPPELPAVVADYGQVGRVLLNLVSNAAKYSVPGGPIHLRARQEASGGSLVFEVSDSGPGIPRDEQDKIFDRFYRSPQRSDMVRRPQGFGLGLSICRALVEAHGGRLTVESAPGTGATFRVALPLNPRQVGAV